MGGGNSKITENLPKFAPYVQIQEPDTGSMTYSSHDSVINLNRSYENITVKGHNHKVRNMIVSGHNNKIFSSDTLNGYSNEIENLTVTGHNNVVYVRVTKDLKVNGHN